MFPGLCGRAGDALPCSVLFLQVPICLLLLRESLGNGLVFLGLASI